MKIIMRMIGVIIISLLFLILVGCNGDYSDEEIEAEMENFTIEELTLVINEANQSEALVGETYYSFKKRYRDTKIYKIDPTRRLQIAKKVLESIKIGCYLKINDENVWLTSSKSDCESLFIAENFVGRTDLYRLLEYFGYSNIDEEKVLDKGNSLSVHYKDQSSFDYFLGIQNKFSSNSCEKLSFFGVETFCFNGIIGEKKNNFEYLIKYLTVLKYTSNVKPKNMLINQFVNAYDFVKDNNLVYYDGSQPESYGENFEEIGCSPTIFEGPIAKNKLGQGTIYVCVRMLHENALEEKIDYASTLYHEANHNFDELSHNEKLGHIICEKDNPPHIGDRDWVSVYGAEINLLFSMSQNEILSCNEREYVFYKAEKMMKQTLCQVPNKPSHGFKVPCS
ncbi:hypothetical protein HON71_01570 [Candidatus Woesearchaeota archaeon]|nr:hypothetical protein [Candidatus Woesearchaeota archaeon]MBT5343073.1 hypothetical protein [Candidatus Woesearchaeota archaeon]